MLSCKQQPNKKYADNLKECLTSEDVKNLNIATYLFEQKLEEFYENSDNNTNFITYLNQTSSIQPQSNFTLDFYLNDKSVEMVKILKDKGTFDKI